MSRACAAGCLTCCSCRDQLLHLTEPHRLECHCTAHVLPDVPLLYRSSTETLDAEDKFFCDQCGCLQEAQVCVCVCVWCGGPGAQRLRLCFCAYVLNLLCAGAVRVQQFLLPWQAGVMPTLLHLCSDIGLEMWASLPHACM
jgi:aspartate/methionine/tyrosine aminotransferase